MRLSEAIPAHIDAQGYARIDAGCARVEAMLAGGDASPDQMHSPVGR